MGPSSPSSSSIALRLVYPWRPVGPRVRGLFPLLSLRHIQSWHLPNCIASSAYSKFQAYILTLESADVYRPHAVSLTIHALNHHMLPMRAGN